jgi:uncharacterized protein (DUF362 family)
MGSEPSGTARWEEAMTREDEPPEETYSAWTVVHAVFDMLTDQGLHPVLGGDRDPGESAADLLRALGITPSAQCSAPITHDVRQELADLREAFMGED